jgi:AcrR family transcriptional regulator
MARRQQSSALPAGTRQNRAWETRQRMLDAARDLFVANGYAATTIEAIADRASVAVQTIYFTFNNKRALLKELVDVSVAGDQEPIPTLERPWVREAIAAPDAAGQLRRHARGAREVYQRVGPVLEVVRSAAAADAYVASLWETNKQQRYAVQVELAKVLRTKPDYRGPSERRVLADILYSVLSPEMFFLLSTDRNWPLARCERWLADVLCRQLTSPD